MSNFFHERFFQMSGSQTIPYSERASQYVNPSKTDEMSMTVAARAAQSRNDNASLLGAPSAASVSNIYHQTGVRAPAHGQQGNTRVYENQFAQYSSSTDDTVYNESNLPEAFRFSNGFNTTSNSSSSMRQQFGTPSMTSMLNGSNNNSSSQMHPSTAVGSSNDNASGNQGNTIRPPQQNQQTHYQLN